MSYTPLGTKLGRTKRGGFTVSYTPLSTKLGMGKEGRFHSELHTSWYQAGYGQGGEVSQ